MDYTKSGSRIEDNYRMYSGLNYKGKCEYCGDIFRSRYPLSKYCSQRCKNDAYMERRKKKHDEKLKKVCPICNTAFTSKRKDALYCSNACKQKAYRKKNLDCTSIGVDTK